MSDPIEIVDDSGEVRRLGLLPQPRASLTRSWKVFGDGIDPDSPAPLPREAWQPVDLSRWCPPAENQSDVGMCASSGTETTYTVARKIAGYDDPRLSAADLYRRVCGGTDQGSLPEDNLIELMERGIATVNTVPYTDWKRDYPAAAAERPLYRGLEAAWCPTAAHVASAVQAGFPVLIGYRHYQRDPVSADGWMDRPSGRWGGHAVCVVGWVRRADGKWGGKILNSWTSSFGQNGYAILPESRVEDGCDLFQAWALRATRLDGGGMPAPQEG